MLNDKIPLATHISICAEIEGWDSETVKSFCLLYAFKSCLFAAISARMDGIRQERYLPIKLKTQRY